jgi:hypothetical protein
MWFLFLEIFFLVTASFAAGAGVTAVGLRLVFKTPDSLSSDEGRVLS